MVEWVQGPDNQEQAALENGRCTLERIENDECVPNPFFVRETGKTLRLPYAPSLSIHVLSPGPNGEIKRDAEQNAIHREISLIDLQKMLGNADFAKGIPFIFTTTGGAIAEIRGPYVP